MFINTPVFALQKLPVQLPQNAPPPHCPWHEVGGLTFGGSGGIFFVSEAGEPEEAKSLQQREEDHAKRPRGHGGQQPFQDLKTEMILNNI